MKIAIIGTGNVGTALGTSFTRAGHEVTFVARDAGKAGEVAASIGAATATSIAAAVRPADVVVLAVPYAATGAILEELGDATRGKVLVDVTNPLTADYSGLATAGGPSAAERISEAADGARVVKAFNTLFASLQADPTALGQTIDGLIAGDDAAAKETVAELVRSIGLRPVDAGPLASARELEAIAWLNIALQLRTGGNWASSFVLVGAPEQAIAA